MAIFSSAWGPEGSLGLRHLRPSSSLLLPAMPAKLKEKMPRNTPKYAKPQGKSPAKPTTLQKRAADESDELDESEEEVDELDAKQEGEGTSGSEGEEEGESGEDDSDENEDVDQEGMERLMKALGEDGLDDFAQEQLRALAGSDDEESDEEEDEDVDEDPGGEDADDAANAGPSEVVAIPVDELSDDEYLDEDAMPRQKVEIDNKVRLYAPVQFCGVFSHADFAQIAMERIRGTIALDPSLPWTETLTVTYPETIDVDVDDDLNRELALYVFSICSPPLSS